MIASIRDGLHHAALVFCALEPSVQVMLIIAVIGCGVCLLPARRSR